MELNDKKKEKEEGSIRDNLPSSPPDPLINYLRELLQEVKETKNILVQMTSKSVISQTEKTTATDHFEEEFEALWSRYPRKQGKKDAFRHYTTARKKGVALQTISDGLNAYLSYIKRNGVQPNYIKCGSTWFCEASWDDDYTADFGKGPKPASAKSFNNFDQRETDYDRLLSEWGQAQ